MEQYLTNSYEETLAVARAFAARLHAGDLLFLQGELGAGKTAFCTGLAQGLHCIDEATSPTFAIVNLYRGPQPFAHFDMYRITTEEDLETAGYFDYLAEGTIVAAEWAENIAAFSEAPRFIISLIKTSPHTRTITIEAPTG